MRWFRLYSDINSNPKILRLSDSLVGQWVKILAASCSHSGQVPIVADLSSVLRKSTAITEKILEALISAKLIDRTENRLVIHGWRKRQFKSDTSSDRVRQFRKRFSNVSETDITDKDNYPSKEGSYLSKTGFAFEASPVSLTEQQTYAWQEEFPDLDLKPEIEQAVASIPLTAGGWHYQLHQHLKHRQKSALAAKKLAMAAKRAERSPPKTPALPPKKKTKQYKP